VVPRPTPVVPSRYLVVVPRPLPTAPRKYFDRGPQVVAPGAARCASQVLDCGSQAVARGAARCLSQILDRGAQAAARGTARCASQVLDHGALVRCPRRREAAAAREEQVGGCTAERCKYSRLYLNSGKEDLAEIYFLRARVVCRSFAEALAHFSTGVSPPAPTAKNLGLGLLRPCRGRRVAACFGRWRTFPLRGPPRYRSITKEIFLYGLGLVFFYGYGGGGGLARSQKREIYIQPGGRARKFPSRNFPLSSR
jgi:hypothetical protein